MCKLILDPFAYVGGHDSYFHYKTLTLHENIRMKEITDRLEFHCLRESRAGKNPFLRMRMWCNGMLRSSCGCHGITFGVSNRAFSQILVSQLTFIESLYFSVFALDWVFSLRFRCQDSSFWLVLNHRLNLSSHLRWVWNVSRDVMKESKASVLFEEFICLML